MKLIHHPRPTQYLLSILMMVFVVGCTSTATLEPTPERISEASPIVTPASTVFPTPTPSMVPTPDLHPDELSLESTLTHQRLDGNRLVSGSGGMLTRPLDIPLSGKPVWVIAAPLQNSSVWITVMESGEVQGFKIDGREFSELDLNLKQLPPGMPPALFVDGDQVQIISPPPEASPSTNPIQLQDGGTAYIDLSGHLRLIRNGEFHTLPVNALPDARILSDQAGRLLFLSGPSDKYPHGVLGDDIEATSMTLVNIQEDDPRVIREIQIDPGEVIEGISPIWVDLDHDGTLEIIVTQSNPGSGARIVVYREDGSLFASGEPIGQGFRWRHQLAVAQFIQGGTQEIAVIRTPHIGGIIEIYSLEGDRLEITGVLAGYSSHQIGSRNLDQALAADFSEDGQLEIVVPNQFFTAVSGIQWGDGELKVVWEAPVGEKISTNLAAVTLPDGRIALGLGQENHLLRIWVP